MIDTELVSTHSGFRLWGEQYKRNLPDIFEVQEEISRKISKGLCLRLTGEKKQHLSKQYTENSDASRILSEMCVEGRQTNQASLVG